MDNLSEIHRQTDHRQFAALKCLCLFAFRFDRYRILIKSLQDPGVFLLTIHRLKQLQFHFLARQSSSIAEYSLVDLQVETLDRFAVSQIEDRLTTLTFHRNGDGDGLSVCRDIALSNGCLAVTKVDALYEIKVSTRNLKGTTCTYRIDVVGSDGGLHKGEGNIYPRSQSQEQP